MKPAFFHFLDNAYIPLDLARSYWSRAVIGGPATCAALARELETAFAEPGFRPARFAVDLFKPTPADEPLTVTTRLVRKGNRIVVGDAELSSDGVVTAQARCTFLRETTAPQSTVWRRNCTPPVPSEQQAAALEKYGIPLFGSDDHPEGWSMNLAEHQGASRKRMWSRSIAAVEGEIPSPFVVAAIVSEAASLVTNWGAGGLESINADVSLTLARTPSTTEMGIEADCHITDAGVTAASAILYDRDGPLGISTVAALGNSANRIDLAQPRNH